MNDLSGIKAINHWAASDACKKILAGGNPGAKAFLPSAPVKPAKKAKNAKR